MIDKIISHRPTRLLLGMGFFFLTNALIAEFIGVKIFSLETTFGQQPMDFSLFGEPHLAFNLSAGVLLWPFVFVLTDLINEYFGKKAVQMLSWMTVTMILYAFAMFYLGILAPPAGFWPPSQVANGVPDMNLAFKAIFGQGQWIIVGSMVAFLLGQLLDVSIFQYFKRITGEKGLWLRSTGSTLVSQLIDSFVVLFIAFYLGAGWKWQLVLAVGIVNYTYKFLIAVLMTPVIYGVHHLLDAYLGHETAEAMRLSAMGDPSSALLPDGQM